MIVSSRRAALLLFVCAGCATWQPVSLLGARTGLLDLPGQRARFEAPDGVRDVRVTSVIGPFAQGVDSDTGRGVRVDLDRVQRVDVRRPNHLLNALIIGGIYLSVFTLGGLSFADGLPPLFGQR